MWKGERGTGEGDEEKTRHSQKALYRSPSYHRGRAHFFAYRKWGRRAEVGEVDDDDDDDDDDIRFCARIRIAIVSIVRLSPSFSLVLRPSSLLPLFPLRRPLLPFSRVFPSTRFSRSPWVGRSQHRPIRPSFVRIPTYSYSRSTSPCKTKRGKGEPDLSPLNGINKLYYACTSP